MVYNWCLNKDTRPVVFSMADQKGNEMASTLAVTSSNRGDMFKAW
ncbi:hypothetical protein Godav_025819, partial [Gossypium davidsonii]|nr:hypothetical protein [Gossypium davidsonii]